MINDGLKIYSKKQLLNIYSYTEDIIETMPTKALDELLSGYSDDVDAMLSEMLNQTAEVMNFSVGLKSEDLHYLTSLEKHMDVRLKKLSYNYFKTTVLGSTFDQGWRNLEWGNLAQLYPWSAFLCARESGKCLKPNTLVMMFDKSLRQIKDIAVGDLVMGPGLTSREVLEIHRGSDEMYEVEQLKGISYTVNSKHDLIFYNTRFKIFVKLTALEFLNISNKEDYVGIRSLSEQRFEIIDLLNKVSISSVGLGEYVGFTCDKDHLFLLEDGTIVKNSFEWSFAFPLWRLYSYDKPFPGVRDGRDNRNRKETCIISNEKGLVRKHVSKINQEILSNDILSEKLNPQRKAFPADSIVTETGSSLWIKSYGSAIRGLHVGATIVDDFLDSSSMWSTEQRLKFNEIFFSEILNIVNEGGYLQVIGCVSPNTIVSTEKGLRKIGDMTPLESYKVSKSKLVEFKEMISGKDGFKESSHYWHNGWTKTKKVILKGGYELECSLIHPFWKRGEGVSDWCQSKDLKIGDWVALKIGDGISNHAEKIDFSSVIDSFDYKSNIKHLDVSTNNYEELIYLIGLYTADGCFDKSRITIIKRNEGIQNFLKTNTLGLKFSPHQEYKFRCQSVVLREIFNFAGCHFKTAIGKNFPDKILGADFNTVKYFLQGLFDGDGNCYVTKDGSIQITLASINEDLISDVHNVLGVLGIISSKRVSPPGISKKVKGIHNIHKCVITGYDSKLFLDIIGFKHSGKSDNVSLRNLEKSLIKNSKFRKTPFWANDDLNYLQITDIKDSENWTVDFHIPDGHNFISNCILSHNTPFHEQDLYYDLKQSKEFQVFEYPAILPNGTVLAPDRFSINQLRKKKGTLSPIQYAREILITPLADGSTIFPMETLMNSTIGMERISLINDRDAIDSFPVKFARIVVGCDFAVSSNIGADYTVYTVWGACPQGNYYLLHVFRKRGVTYNEQLQQILSINRRFKPNSIICENNGFQSYMSEGLRAQGLQGIVKPFTTTAQNKKDLYLGLPSLATMFERGEIKIPYKDGVSKDTANWLFGEFNSITFNSDSGKLESTAGHDDGPMSSFMAVQDLRENISKYEFYYA